MPSTNTERSLGPTHEEEEQAKRNCLFCLEGWVFLGAPDHDGEEVIEAIRCRRCPTDRSTKTGSRETDAGRMGRTTALRNRLRPPKWFQAYPLGAARLSEEEGGGAMQDPGYGLPRSSHITGRWVIEAFPHAPTGPQGSLCTCSGKGAPCHR
jgi:hypothetical protein